MKPRPWYKLHWTTWLVLLVVGGTLAWLQVVLWFRSSGFGIHIGEALASRARWEKRGVVKVRSQTGVWERGLIGIGIRIGRHSVIM